MKHILVILLAICMIQKAYSEATTSGPYYVVSKGLNVRMAASSDGKLAKTLLQNEKVTVLEIRNGWARISDDERIEGTRDQATLWVAAKFLTPIKPKETKSLNHSTSATKSIEQSPIVNAIKTSDDFSKYKNIFISTTKALIADERCTLKEFEEMGGWWRSPNDIPDPVYFLYCGGMDLQNRIFLNTETGSVFR